MNIKQIVAAIAVVVESDPQPLDLHLEMAVPLVQVLSVANTNTAALKHVMFLIGRKEMFYLMTHSSHFIYGYMASDIW